MTTISDEDLYAKLMEAIRSTLERVCVKQKRQDGLAVRVMIHVLVGAIANNSELINVRDTQTFVDYIGDLLKHALTQMATRQEPMQ